MNQLPLEVTCQDVKQSLDASEDFVFLDCREAVEYETAKIEAATLLPMSELSERVGELDGKQGERIVVHCHHGGRSLQVANWLREQGYTGAQSMAGGIEVWALEVDVSVPRY
ncbi:rhodanese-like domain-containing protein [Adhaeretor mobilis]|uniref:Putative adenylyltransferase/sulfurtransferase MoeZ n=1 Tax=Adhaeretor mobilis TaxID=1930276 RepID=A0A517MU27_9BACT|nr:rhodanese-like domain-containing protein [Adhaeretor mobilis]QDS98393.1 putative adenylyltransferase/sulfurtransferase MoeZ [Adhaeretor mobilis]